MVRSSVNSTLLSTIFYKIHTSKLIRILATVLKSVSTQSPLPCSSLGAMSLVILCYIFKCFSVLSGYVTFLKYLSQMGEMPYLFYSFRKWWNVTIKEHRSSKYSVHNFCLIWTKRKCDKFQLKSPAWNFIQICAVRVRNVSCRQTAGRTWWNQWLLFANCFPNEPNNWKFVI